MPPAKHHQIRSLWDRLSGFPGGRKLYSFLIGRMAPYTGTIRAEVVELGPEGAVVAMADRRRVRNHLSSVHAIALMNLAELTTGLALHYDVPGDVRAILTGLSIEYQKKARGRLVAAASVDIPEITGPTDVEVETAIRDEQGDVVATAKAQWLLDLRKG